MFLLRPRVFTSSPWVYSVENGILETHFFLFFDEGSSAVIENDKNKLKTSQTNNQKSNVKKRKTSEHEKNIL